MKGKGSLNLRLLEKASEIEILISDTGSGMKKRGCK
jgi:hypothetical protein